MLAEDVTYTSELALTELVRDQAVMRHKPGLLNDNGSCYISGDFRPEAVWCRSFDSLLCSNVDDYCHRESRKVSQRCVADRSD